MALSGALLYVSDLERMKAFYRDGLGLEIRVETDAYVEFACAVGSFGLHAIPPHIAAGVEAGPARAETPIKLYFQGDRDRLTAAGARWVERPWGPPDAIDPEGNIFHVQPLHS